MGVSGPGKSQLAKFQRGLQAARSPAFKAKLYKQLSLEALALVSECFEGERDPYGRKWKPLKNPRGRRIGGMILSDTARLKNGFRASSSADNFTISSRVAYAAIHQYGGTITRKAGSRTKLVIAREASGRFRKGAKGRRVTTTFGAGTSVIPARPFLPSQGDMGPRWTPRLKAISMKALAKEVTGQ
jgi:phage virion morphogenesis protein